MINIKKYRNNNGFTIVELLVVIVVIGILAAITIVSYTGITARANNANAQSTANSAIQKVQVFNADGPTGNWPTTYTQMVNAASTATFYLNNNISFTNASNATSSATMTATLNDSTHMNVNATKTVDFSLCGTGPAGAAPGNYAGITIPTGVKIGYWDYQNSIYSTTPQTVGTISGGNVACFKEGLAEATVATARAYYNDNASVWPTAAQLATYSALSTTTADLPTGLTVLNVYPVVGIIAGTQNTTVSYSCKTGGCAANGGRVGFWDTITGPALTYIYFGGATSGDTFIAG